MDSSGVLDIYCFCSAANVLQAKAALSIAQDDPYDISFCYKDISTDDMVD